MFQIYSFITLLVYNYAMTWIWHQQMSSFDQICPESDFIHNMAGLRISINKFYPQPAVLHHPEAHRKPYYVFQIPSCYDITYVFVFKIGHRCDVFVFSGVIPHPVACEHRWLVKAPRWIHGVPYVSDRRSWRCSCYARLWNFNNSTNQSRL